MLTMTSLCKATGVNASTIRTWERRYGIPNPVRLDNGRRRYSEGDVKRIQLLVALLDQGAQIGEIVSLPVEDLENRLSQLTVSSNFHSRTESAILSRLKTATLDVRLHDIRKELGLAITQHAPATCVETILSPYMRWIGDEWHNKTLTVAIEHGVSALVRQSVVSAASSQSWDAGGPMFVFGTPQNELHDLGALFAWYIASASGLNSVFLGANVPSSDLPVTLKHFGAQTMVFSVVRQTFTENVLQEIEKISSSDLPEGSELWIGCPKTMASAFDGLANVKVFHNYTSFERALKLRNQLLLS